MVGSGSGSGSASASASGCCGFQSIVVGGGTLDDVLVSRRLLRFGDELRGEDRDPPDPVLAPPERPACPADGHDGGALAARVELDTRDPGEVLPQPEGPAPRAVQIGEDVTAVGRLGRRPVLGEQRRALGLRVARGDESGRLPAHVAEGVARPLGLGLEVSEAALRIVLGHRLRDPAIGPLRGPVGRERMVENQEERERDDDGARQKEQRARRRDRTERHPMGIKPQNARSVDSRESGFVSRPPRVRLRLVPPDRPVYGVAMQAAPQGLVGRVLATRNATVELTRGLEVDDWSAQSMPDASPVKWHLGHTSWFFDRFVLRPLGAPPITRASAPECVHADAYDYLFNSYYESVGARQPRARRGLLTRPTVAEVLAYRRAVDARLADLEDSRSSPRLGEIAAALELGQNHEEQHQELLLTDVKHLFGQSPLAPALRPPSPDVALPEAGTPAIPLSWHRFDGGLVTIGHGAGSFAFDNEGPRHQVFLRPFEIASRLVTCGEYLAFIEDGGYRRPELWLSEGWSFVNSPSGEPTRAPLYWDLEARSVFTLAGRRAINLREPVAHVTYYEADAFARWAGARLPREAEWEIAAVRSVEGHPGADDRAVGTLLEDGRLHPAPARRSARGLVQMIGDVWEWTSSAYEPYPGFRPLAGAFAEYNGKFMVSQLVLRGGSCATPARHIRPSYRNFFPPSAAWQFTGIRLAKDVA